MGTALTDAAIRSNSVRDTTIGLFEALLTVSAVGRASTGPRGARRRHKRPGARGPAEARLGATRRQAQKRASKTTAVAHGYILHEQKAPNQLHCEAQGRQSLWARFVGLLKLVKPSKFKSSS